MIGLLIIAHEPLGSALASAARHVFGHVDQLDVLDVPADGDRGVLEPRAHAMATALDSGDGVLILTDLFGATPSNIATTVAAPYVRVLAGVNLPMLLRAIAYRADTLVNVAEKAATGGTLGILNVGPNAPQKQNLVPDDGGDPKRRNFQQQQQQQQQASAEHPTIDRRT
jgi:PTS system ascorbate-specific IIA component